MEPKREKIYRMPLWRNGLRSRFKTCPYLGLGSNPSGGTIIAMVII